MVKAFVIRTFVSFTAGRGSLRAISQSTKVISRRANSFLFLLYKHISVSRAVSNFLHQSVLTQSSQLCARRVRVFVHAYADYILE